MAKSVVSPPSVGAGPAPLAGAAAAVGPSALAAPSPPASLVPAPPSLPAPLPPPCTSREKRACCSSVNRLSTDDTLPVDPPPLPPAPLGGGSLALTQTPPPSSVARQPDSGGGSNRTAAPPGGAGVPGRTWTCRAKGRRQLRGAVRKLDCERSAPRSRLRARARPARWSGARPPRSHASPCCRGWLRPTLPPRTASCSPIPCSRI